MYFVQHNPAQQLGSWRYSRSSFSSLLCSPLVPFNRQPLTTVKSISATQQINDSTYICSCIGVILMSRWAHCLSRSCMEPTDLFMVLGLTNVSSIVMYGGTAGLCPSMTILNNVRQVLKRQYLNRSILKPRTASYGG